MPLEPSIRRRLDAIAALGLPPSEQLMPADMRDRLSDILKHQPPFDTPDIRSVDIELPSGAGSVESRLYYPSASRGLPLVIYFHGGGWVTGTLASHDQFCRKFAQESGTAVLSVAYRLAPEHPFPAAPEDCLSATDWAFTHAPDLTGEVSIAPDQIYVAGDSAGGNLAAVVSLMRRDRSSKQHALAGQILLWPVTGYYEPPTDSYLANAEGLGLTRAGMIHFWNLYLPDRQDAEFPYAVPLHSHDLSGLPPALVITAEYDVLRDEGNEYAVRLAAAGVPVEHHCVSGVNHGFAVWPDHDPDLPQAQEARSTMVRWIHQHKSGSSRLPSIASPS